MCGKFTQLATWGELVAFSEPLDSWTQEDLVTAAPNTPMRDARILRVNENGNREFAMMRWGFADRRAKTPTRPSIMHARAETIDELPTFAHLFANRHCRGILGGVATFNVGEELPNGKTKQWVVTPKDRKPLAFAVLCEKWTNDTADLWTYVMVTVPANPTIAPVTDRMPALLPPEAWPTWLGEKEASLSNVKNLLQTFDDNGAWDIAPQQTPPKKPKPAAPTSGDLFS